MKLIETGVDRLVSLVAREKRISVKDAAKELGVSLATVEEWTEFLEEEGIISIDTKLGTDYLLEKKLGKRELVQKVKEAKAENESFMRKIESSINSLRRDSDEIKLIDSEFKEIKDLLKENYGKLSKKLKDLEEHRERHGKIQKEKKEVEERFEKKLSLVDEKLKKEQGLYADVLNTVNSELEQIQKERSMVQEIKKSEDALSKRIDELNKDLAKARESIQKGNLMLEEDETKLSKAKDKAEQIKHEILQYRSSLDSINKEVKESRKTMESMEKEFLEDVDKLQKGEFGKIQAIKDSKQMLDQIQAFFDKTKDMQELIDKAEQEEKELREHFESIAKKAKAFHVLATKEEVKKELEGLQTDLRAIEERKSALGSQLTKLRGLIRKVGK